MLNDVAEHVQKTRYGCLFLSLQKRTHVGSVVYMHTPTPEAQLMDTNQYYENVLPHHFLVTGMANAGFELLEFRFDLETECGGKPRKTLPLHYTKAKCYMNGWPKYYHVLFVRVADDSSTFQL